MATILRAYRFALDPIPEAGVGAAIARGRRPVRLELGLAKCKERYAAEKKWYSAVDLHKLWNAQKKTDPALAWWSENSKCCYQEAFRNLERALGDFIKSKKGQRRGKRLGFPRYKKKRKSKASFRVSEGIRCDGTTVTLPRLGVLATHESTEKLANRVKGGTTRILSATVTRVAQRWFVSLVVADDRDIPVRHARPGSAIGIDIGIKTLITGADNEGNVIAIHGPKPLRAGQRRLRRVSRALSRKRPGSARRRRSAARLGRLHARIANLRRDAAHKATSLLVARYETVVAEDLNVAGMAKNHYLAAAIVDQGFGQVRRMLAYKTAWSGGRLVLADRFYPSSKTCSGCGAVKAKLALSERTYQCGSCGLVTDRDVNAARNLLNLAASGAESINARASGQTIGHAVMKREPGTHDWGKTGTAVWQRAATA